MKKTFATIFTLILLSALFPDDASVVLTEEEKAWLNEKKEILFVCQSHYPPFEFENEDIHSDGMSIELARWISTEFGFKARFRHMSFQEAQDAVLSGRADAITSLFYSEIRDEKFDFTTMTWDVPAYIFVRSARPDIKELQDLQGKKVAMQRGDYAEQFLESSGVSCEIIWTDTFGEAVDLVVSGVADTVLGDEQIVLYHLFSNNLSDFIKSIGEPLYIGQNSMAVIEGQTILRSILNKGMERAREEGIFQKIDRKWVGTVYDDSPAWLEKYLPLLIIIPASLAVIVVFIVIWNLQLRRTVLRRTKELYMNQLQLETLFNAVPALLWLKDPQGRYLKCNHRFEDQIGLSEKEIIGQCDYDFFDKEQADEFESYDKLAIDEGTSRFETDIVFPKDGHKQLLDVRKTSIYDRERTLLGILGIAHDVTELREKKTFLDAIVENIPNMVFVKDAEELKFVSINKAGEELLGFKRDLLIGKSDYDFFPRKEADFFTGKDREVLENKTFLDIPEEVVMTGRGESRYLHTKKISLLDSHGNPLYLLGISEDITERKAQEEAKEKLIAELQEAMDNIKTLGNLLPICSHCKKIRDDEGYWNQVEDYFHRHTGADFTHGLCPDCAQELYPKFFPKDKDK